MDYDVIIIGGGPAGLTAAIYTTRRGLKTAVISKDIGGQITRTNEIENYPGFDHIAGSELAKLMFSQAKKFGAEFIFDGATKIKKLKHDFSIETARKKLKAKSIILAFGKSPRELGVPGEEEYKGRGVSYCATCDAPFFKSKTVAVVGGGNSALDAAIISSKVAKKVYLIHRSEFRGEEVMLEQIKKTKNIVSIVPNEISKIEGSDSVERIILKDGKTLETDGVLIEIGFVIDRSLIEGVVKMDKSGQVLVDEFQSTSVKGIFAAGDLTQTPFKQIIISAGEGAKAALSCFDYLQKLEGKKGIAADWH